MNRCGMVDPVLAARCQRPAEYLMTIDTCLSCGTPQGTIQTCTVCAGSLLLDGTVECTGTCTTLRRVTQTELSRTP
jgi:hypothetical protein